ncbi:DUF1330 domain-containing protein [Nocardia sp. NPDC059240]|uniref:DUF1330 domain-containing protein n=1 Tax=Nocardia sp. NPDC059240 TaxID=3346786 RepID=UPI00369234CD
MAVVPNPDQFARFAAATDTGPVVMLNLIKFSDRAEYETYGGRVLQMVHEQKGRLLWHGESRQTLIGEADWDYVALVEYPDRQAFLSMVTAPEYQRIHAHREAGIEHTVLLACDALTPPATGE